MTANTTPTAEQKANIRSTAGLDWAVLKQAWDSTSQYGGTFLVIRNGWIAAEWGGTGTAYNLASCTKTLTSLAMHRMFEMGASGALAYPVAADDLAYQYLPSSWGDNATLRTITLRHLLTMSSGLEPDDNPPSPKGDTSDYQLKLLDPPVRTVPDAEWSYASLPVDVLTLVVEFVTGQTLGSFFRQQIGSVIGVASLQWGALGTHSYASAHATITGRDMARVAYLMLRQGTWNSTSLISGSRVDDMTHWAPSLASTVYGPQVQFPTDPDSQERFGWLVWTNSNQSPYVGAGVPTDAFYCAGWATKFGMVIPSLDMIIIRLQQGPTPWSDAVFTGIASTVMSAVVDGSLNSPPSVQITGPAEGASFTAPASLTISASASDSDGSVTQVAFYAGASLLGTDTSAPYSFDWSNVPAGSYALTARATDDDGATTTSTAVNVTVSGNTAPTVTNPGSQTSVVGVTVTLQIVASDADGNTLSHSATGLPAGLIIDAVGGLVSGKPTKSGKSSTTVAVSDGKGGTTRTTFQWMVKRP